MSLTGETLSYLSETGVGHAGGDAPEDAAAWAPWVRLADLPTINRPCATCRTRNGVPRGSREIVTLPETEESALSGTAPPVTGRGWSWCRRPGP
ncbi:hypothetical protein Ppa06_17310 [Planomonospora parontospora subsp. parontospora]|uniref:Uncharacterized protein n=2 Tax=Planomonospora parontospora TaxID=58119 RepID=A0AA37BEA0_9ACTN|nr:hypothetical protein GCM10010126_17870 [Planomonospora parontospora]GII07933.1 hypothetical protein Ppa06_17310 [Planomonospora parontospora subsp. parontospora]